MGRARLSHGCCDLPRPPPRTQGQPPFHLPSRAPSDRPSALFCSVHTKSHRADGLTPGHLLAAPLAFLKLDSESVGSICGPGLLHALTMATPGPPLEALTSPCLKLFKGTSVQAID